MSKRHSRSRRRRGFTLMEILLVLAILVVLGSMVGVGYFKVQQGAMRNIAEGQIATLKSAVNMYTLHIGTPPNDLQSLLEAPPELSNPTKWQGPYLEESQLPLDPWNQDYQYEIIDAANGKFRIWTNGPDMQPDTQDDVSTKL
jgi:general secretion pathway protein G